MAIKYMSCICFSVLVSSCPAASFSQNIRDGVPVRFSHVSGRKKIATSDAATCDSQNGSSILKAIARGMAWLKMLDEGKVGSIRELAAAVGLERKYVRYILRLAFLSPRIIRAVMAGREPDGLSLARLRTITTPVWSEQERLLGM